MKKKTIINLIRYYTEKKDQEFRNEAYEIANQFDQDGDYQLAEYVMSLLSDMNKFVPQMSGENFKYAKKVDVNNSPPLPLPKLIESDIMGIINAINYNAGINKFLFKGAPGTGKTETVKRISKITNRELYIVDFSRIIDSHLGQTSKNILELFDEINNILNPDKIIIFFDEIDSLALNRTDSKDLREMGRATSTVLKGLDNLKKDILLIATTNLFEHFDKALLRRFDYIVDFNKYTKSDLMYIAEIFLDIYLGKFNFAKKNSRLFKKIIDLKSELPYPGELENIIKTSIAFSNPNDEYDYLKRLYKTFSGSTDINLRKLNFEGFTTREIEILTSISKSQVSRELNTIGGD